MMRLPCASLVVVIMLGCGSERSDLPLAPVSGTVTLDDKPLSAAMLMLIPTGETRGPGASGRTDAAGKFELKTPDGKFAGAVAGTYQVVINKFVNADGTDFLPNDEISPMDAGFTEALPPKYSDVSRTELKATIPEGGGELEFKLRSQMP